MLTSATTTTLTTMSKQSSQALFDRAQRVIPGGVNSPVRAAQAIGTYPLFISHADGAYVMTEDGQELIDLCGSWGPLILGHAHEEVLDAIAQVMKNGTTFGAPTVIEIEYAEMLCEALPSLERVRVVSSGTEATMAALRLARGYTGRDKIVKIDGGYHGHADVLLAAAGSGAATLGVPGSGGVPEAVVQHTLLVPYNNLGAVEEVFRAHKHQIACVIVEPVAGNVGVVPPAPDYLAGLRTLTENHGSLLIFDEVITGFRLAYGGAQTLYRVKPDLTCLGKIIGGGMPAAAFGGRSDIMRKLAPEGDVYQAGTLSGNPLALAAGKKTLEILRRPGTYERLEEVGARLAAGLTRAFQVANKDLCLNRVGSMMTAFFQKGPVENYGDAKKSNTRQFAAYARAMREQGVYLPPSQFEACFVSLAHSDADIDRIVDAASASLKAIRD
jgi:glutamate-1-semialdehyde 2,1-aminomutase